MALFTRENFKTYLEKVMQLLFSEVKMGVNILLYEDDDIVGFVKALRYELIQTFTCIELLFNDKPCQQYLTPFILDKVAFIILNLMCKIIIYKLMIY